MARHQEGHFYESDSLNIPNPVLPEDDGVLQAQTPVSGPAEEMEGPSSPAAPETAAEDTAPETPDEEPFDEEPTPGDEPPADGGDGDDSGAPDDDDDEGAAILQERVRIADEAWDDEARRVDPAEPGKAQKAWAEADRRRHEDPETKTERPAKAKDDKKKKKKKSRKKKAVDDRHTFIKTLLIILACGILFLTTALLVVSNFIDHPLLTIPRRVISSIVSPVQQAFSGVTDSVVDYLRTLKIRGEIEYQYEQLTLLLDDYATMGAQNEEYRRTIQELYTLLDEQERNRDLNPLAASVVLTDSGNYFSTLSLDVGRVNGVENYMAVVAQGGLVGVTYDVEETTCKVRCIINSDCTVAALIQSTRDQGSVKGTLGTTGEPMCRMYYLPDNSVARPGDVVVTSGVGLEFPKGIPIGEVRESTRGMEDNKSYVVIEPIVDFQHLEYVTVYRYQPSYAEAAQSRSGSYSATLEPLITARPVPTLSLGGTSDFLFSQEPASEPTPEGETPEPTPEVTPSPEPTPEVTPDPNATETPENLTYLPPADPDHTEEPTPRPTFTPTPSPAPTQDPGGMMMEDET